MAFSPRARSQSTLRAAATPTPSPCNADTDGLEKLQYQDGSAWKDIPSPFYVPKGATVKFRAVRKAGSSTTCVVTWSDLASGKTGDEASVTFATASSTGTDYKKVTAKCVNPVTADVLVYVLSVLNNFKTGYTEPSTSSTIFKTVTFTVTPHGALDQVEIKTSTPALIELKNEQRNASAGTIKIDVYGVSRSLNAFDARVNAIDKRTTSVLAYARGSVVIPSAVGTPHDTPHGVVSGKNVVANQSSTPPANPPLGFVWLLTAYYQPVNVIVWDQFQQIIDSIYDGETVYENEPGRGWFSINVSLSGGKYTDPVGFGMQRQPVFQVPTGSAAANNWPFDPIVPLTDGTGASNPLVRIAGHTFSIANRSVKGTAPNKVDVIWP